MTSTGQSWFALSAAEFGFSKDPTGGGTTMPTPNLSDLSFTLGQNAVTGTLDTALVAGTPLTAEVATYGSNATLQSDYVFSQGTLDSHTNTSGASNAQVFDLAPKGFLETQYDDSGSEIGSATYNPSSTTLAVAAGTRAPTTTNAQPAPVDTYVQFIGSGGTPLVDASGSSWFKISGTTSELENAGTRLVLGELRLDLGDTDVATQLDAAYLSGTALQQVNVATYPSGGAFQSYQSFSTAKVASRQTSNDSNEFSFSYTGYGERIAGTNPTNDGTASAGTSPSIPTALVDVPAAALNASTPASPSQLSYVGALTVAGRAGFAGTTSQSKGFIALSGFSIDIATKGGAASFEVDQTQAAILAQELKAQPQASLEIAGYVPGGARTVDYVLGGLSFGETDLDTTTGLDSVEITYTSIQETESNQTARTGSIQPIRAPAGAEPTVCFAGGTRIATLRGEIAVEDLVVGDLATTASGEARPIRWLGHRRIDCRMHPRPCEVHPVRIAAHAFGECSPARDLLVSPGHAICVDILGEVLVPAAALVNGATIAQVEVDAVTYWHVELDSHDVILAEGLPAESYIDMGNRGFFARNDAVARAAPPDTGAREARAA